MKRVRTRMYDEGDLWTTIDRQTDSSRFKSHLSSVTVAMPPEFLWLLFASWSKHFQFVSVTKMLLLLLFLLFLLLLLPFHQILTVGQECLVTLGAAWDLTPGYCCFLLLFCSQWLVKTVEQQLLCIYSCCKMVHTICILAMDCSANIYLYWYCTCISEHLVPG